MRLTTEGKVASAKKKVFGNYLCMSRAIASVACRTNCHKDWEKTLGNKAGEESKQFSNSSHSWDWR